MKTSIILIILTLVTIINTNTCNRIPNETSNTLERQWWKNLNETWEIVFLREIDKIGVKPSDEDLKTIINLESINCDHFPLGETNLEPLRMLKRLKYVSAGSCFIQNIDALSVLDSLIDVNIPDNHISSLEPLRAHKMLESLYAQITNIESLDPLSYKENLQVLVIFSTNIKTIKPIMDLPELSIVQFPNKNIPESELMDFKKKHPDCEVNF